MSGLRIEPAGADVRAAWSALAEQSGSVFATPEWVEAWQRHCGRRWRPDLRAATLDGNVAAVLPMVRAGRPLRLLRFAGHGPADELGPVCAPGLRGAVLEALVRSLGDRDVLLADHLPGDVVDGVPGGRVLRREASPVMHLGGAGWDAYLARRSRNFREQVRRKERRMVREHGARFRLAGDPERLARDLDVLIDLHERRWGEASSAFAGPRRAFHHDFARSALERGWLRLWLLEVADAPVAAWLGYRFAGTESYYQAGRDPAWDAQGVGAILLHHTMRAAADDGIETYRLLRGGEQYKARYAAADPGIGSVAAAGSSAGRLGIAAAGAALRARAVLRRRRSAEH